MKLADIAKRLKEIQRLPIAGFPCKNCNRTGEFQDSCEGGIWTLCDCPANMGTNRMNCRIDRPPEESTFVLKGNAAYVRSVLDAMYGPEGKL